jgi:hypothetical protein
VRRRRGKDTTTRLVPHQYCNDWITVSNADGSPAGAVGPLQVRLDPEDFEFFAGRDPSHPTHGNHGSFWREFELREDGTFARATRS